MAASLGWVPLRGGVPSLCGWMRPAGSHMHRTPAQHTARRQMHARQHTRRPVPSVCVRNVRLQANRKTCVSSRVWRNYINIFIYYAKPEEDTYILPFAARAAFRTAKEHQAAAYIYRAIHTAATLPRCSAYRWTPPGRPGTHRESRPGATERSGAKWCDIRRYNCKGLTVIRRNEDARTHGAQRALYKVYNV